jgi:hypothetical protein
VATLRVVTDLVVRLVPEPLRDLPVLLSLTGKLLLDQERFVGRLRSTGECEHAGKKMKLVSDLTKKQGAITARKVAVALDC